VTYPTIWTDQSWEEQFKRFLKTGEDFKRASEDIQAEAQKLVDAATDPEKSARSSGESSGKRKR